MALKTVLSAASAIRDDLARRISHPKNLIEPYRFDDRTPTDTRAQQTLVRGQETRAQLMTRALGAGLTTPPECLTEGLPRSS